MKRTRREGPHLSSWTSQRLLNAGNRKEPASVPAAPPVEEPMNDWVIDRFAQTPSKKHLSQNLHRLKTELQNSRQREADLIALNRSLKSEMHAMGAARLAGITTANAATQTDPDRVTIMDALYLEKLRMSELGETRKVSVVNSATFDFQQRQAGQQAPRPQKELECQPLLVGALYENLQQQQQQQQQLLSAPQAAPVDGCHKDVYMEEDKERELDEIESCEQLSADLQRNALSLPKVDYAVQEQAAKRDDNELAVELSNEMGSPALAVELQEQQQPFVPEVASLDTTCEGVPKEGTHIEFKETKLRVQLPVDYQKDELSPPIKRIALQQQLVQKGDDGEESKPKDLAMLRKTSNEARVSGPANAPERNRRDLTTSLYDSERKGCSVEILDEDCSIEDKSSEEKKKSVDGDAMEAARKKTKDSPPSAISLKFRETVASSTTE